MIRKQSSLQVFRFPYDMSSHTGKIVYSQNNTKVLEKNFSSLTFTSDGLTASFTMSAAEIMLFSEDLIAVQVSTMEGLKENVSRKITLDPSYVLVEGYSFETPIYITFYPEVSVTNVLIGNEGASIPCNQDGTVYADMTITIPFAGYIGAARAVCTLEDPLLPVGMTLVSNTPSTNSADGSAVISVRSGSNLGGNETGELSLVFTCNGIIYNKKFSWSKTRSGQGAPGEPATTVVCSNEAVTIPCKKDGSVAAAQTINVPFAGFIGIVKSACTVAVSGLPSGITVSSNTPGAAGTDGLLVLAVAANSTLGALTTLSGEITLTFTCNTISFVKKLSWSKAMAGVDGLSIVNATPYYISQLETDPAPAKPTTNPPTGWSTTEPTYEISKVVYTVWLTEYSDNTFAYSDVSLMGSYVAATEAYEKAEEAENASTVKYGTCTTLANVPVKDVIADGFRLFTGAEITVGFGYPNTINEPALNVNGTGSKPIYVAGAPVSATNKLLWEEYAEITFVYNGTAWVVTSHPVSYYAECSTASGTANKAVSIPKCVICKGTVLSIQMSYENTVAAPAISMPGTGAIPMRAGGVAIPATSIYNWVSTSTVSFTFDGQYWSMNNTSDIADRNYFWHDTAGAHVTTQPGDATTGPNVLIDADSLDIREGTETLASFGSSVKIGKTDKSYIEIDSDKFEAKTENSTYFTVENLTGKEVVQTKKIGTGEGTTSNYEMEIPVGNITLVSASIDGTDVTSSTTVTTTSINSKVTFGQPAREGNVFEVHYTTTSDFPYMTYGGRMSGSKIGYNSTALGANNTASGNFSVAEGNRSRATGAYTHAEGNSGATGEYAHSENTAKAYGNYSHAEGVRSEASGNVSHAEGMETTASGEYSHSEGYEATASGDISHAEGQMTTASGDDSHAEGMGTIAQGDFSHAEGINTRATGEGSHAEGNKSRATGYISHASGDNTYATRDYQTVIGKYNALDSTNKSTDAAFVIGGGTESARKDIFSVDWNGNVTANGTIKADVWKTARNLTVGNQTVLVNGSGNYSWPNPLKIGYYGSDNANTDGWYKVMTISQTGYSDCNLNLLITSGFYIRATGLLYVHVRCNNGTVFDIQSVKWMYRYGFHTDDVYVKDNGNNTWSLYVYQRHDQYGRIQIQILTETGTSASQWNINLTSNTTKESAAPTGGVVATDGATVLTATNNVLKSGDTMGGDLYLKRTSIDASKANNNVSSKDYPTTFCVVDTAGRIIGRVENVVNTNGSIGLYGYVRNYNTSGTQVAQKGIGMYMNKSGNLTYDVSDPANFRSAIGVTAAPIVGAADIGTDHATMASGSSWISKGVIGLSAGKYIFQAMLEFSNSSTAGTYRRMSIGIGTASSASDAYSQSIMPVTGAWSVLNVTAILDLSTATNIYLLGMQNSGVAIPTVGRCRYMRFA